MIHFFPLQGKKKKKKSGIMLLSPLFYLEKQKDQGLFFLTGGIKK